MSKLNVSPQQIYAAIESLIRSGSSPTVAKVRSTLGDKGNANTILTGIHQWFDERGPYLLAALDNPDAVAQINLKSAMKDATKKSLEAISKINEDYEKKQAEQTQYLDDRQAELEQRERAMLETGNAKDQHIADLQARLTKLEEDACVIQAKLKLESDMVSDLEARLNTQTQNALLEATKSQEQLNHAAEQIQALNATLTQSQSDKQTLTGLNKDLEVYLARTRAELNAAADLLEARTQAAQDAKHSHQSEVDTLRSQLTLSHNLNELVKANHKMSQATIDEFYRRIRQDTQKAVQNSVDAIHALGKDTQKRLIDISNEGSTALSQIGELDAKITKLKQDAPKAKPGKQPLSD